MRIASNGNVGIGFTSPDSSPLSTTKLSVSGNTYVAGTLGVGNTAPPVKFAVNNGVVRTSTAKTYSTFIHTNDSDDYRVGLATAVKGGTTANDRYVSLEGASYRLSTDTFTNEFDLVLNPIAGNVGIGTSTPNAKLDIQGTQGQLFSVTDDLSGSIFAVADISGVPIFDVNSSGVSYFDGNVGIGTIDPLGKLMVRDDTAGAPTRLIVSNGGTVQAGTTARLSFYEGTSEKGYIERRRDGSGKIAFVTPADDNPFVWENPTGEIMRINNSNVGINTTNPISGKLVVEGDPYVITNSGQALGGIDLRTNAAVATGVYGAAISFGTNGTGRAAISSVQGSSDADRQGLVFFTHGSGTGSADSAEAMRISHDGKVGISSDSPGALLDVSDRVYIDTYSSEASGNNPVISGFLRIRAGAKTGWGVDDQLGKLEFYGADTSGVGARTAASIIAVCETGNGTSTTTFGSGLAFYTSPYNATQEERIRITDGGDVGIGITDPECKLHIVSTTTDNSKTLLLQNSSTGDASVMFNISG